MDIFQPEVTQQKKPTRQFLRQRQVEELKSDETTLTNYLNSPGIQDKGAVKTQLRRVQQALREQSPPKLEGAQLDKVVAHGKKLEETILEGMPSSEEMRKNPPGAVGKHMRWERKNKTAIMEWKNVQVATNQGSDDPDVANVERLRPATSTLNMQNAQIPGKEFSVPTAQYMDNYDRIEFENKGLRKRLESLESEQVETPFKED